MAALKTFTVSYRGIRIKVRVLATIFDVYGEYLVGSPRLDGMLVHAFFRPLYGSGAKHIGIIVLPLYGRLEELIPHEVIHAVLHKMCSVESLKDEAFATAVGVLSARIARKIGAMA